MKKITDATIFHCDYCNKISLSAGGMRLHEISCKKNPVNLTPCASCIHCLRESSIISDQDYEVENIKIGDEISKDFLRRYNDGRFNYYAGEYGGEEFAHHKITEFTCKVDGAKMYHNKVNRLSKAKAELIKSRCNKQMPNECSNYENN